MSQFPSYATGGATDWTRGFRAAWFYFRSGCAWWLLEKALVMFPKSDPQLRQIAIALRDISTAAVSERKDA